MTKDFAYSFLVKNVSLKPLQKNIAVNEDARKVIEDGNYFSITWWRQWELTFEYKCLQTKLVLMVHTFSTWHCISKGVSNCL